MTLFEQLIKENGEAILYKQFLTQTRLIPILRF